MLNWEWLCAEQLQQMLHYLTTLRDGARHDPNAARRPSLWRSLAAGASVDAAVAVATGQARSAAAIVRPPGHHAESGMAMGFCFYNNAAVAARAARAAGAARVLILDWVRLLPSPLLALKCISAATSVTSLHSMIVWGSRNIRQDGCCLALPHTL